MLAAQYARFTSASSWVINDYMSTTTDQTNTSPCPCGVLISPRALRRDACPECRQALAALTHALARVISAGLQQSAMDAVSYAAGQRDHELPIAAFFTRTAARLREEARANRHAAQVEAEQTVKKQLSPEQLRAERLARADNDTGPLVRHASLDAMRDGDLGSAFELGKAAQPDPCDEQRERLIADWGRRQADRGAAAAREELETETRAGQIRAFSNDAASIESARSAAAVRRAADDRAREYCAQHEQSHCRVCFGGF